MKIVLATRGSQLALWQANETRRLLLARDPRHEVEILVVQSSGDKDQKTELARFGLTGIFTAEVDHAVVTGAAHAGVHSLKDMTTTLSVHLVLASCLQRAPVEDVLLTRDGNTLADLATGARVATGSVRRAATVRRLRPDLEVVGVRGNVDTRLSKLERGDFEALMMARAGLERLGLTARISEVLDVERSLPAVGQGIVGITCRADDRAAMDVLAGIAHQPSFAAARAERALLHGLHGGCNAPVGAHARVDGGELELRARVLSVDGRECLEDRLRGSAGDAASIGTRLAEALLARGAARLIEEARAR